MVQVVLYQLIRKCPRKRDKEVEDCFPALELLKAVNRLVMFSNIMHSPAFFRLRELPKYNGTCNSLSGIFAAQWEEEKQSWEFSTAEAKTPLEALQQCLFPASIAPVFANHFYHHLTTGCFIVLLTCSPIKLFNDH